MNQSIREGLCEYVISTLRLKVEQRAWGEHPRQRKEQVQRPGGSNELGVCEERKEGQCGWLEPAGESHRRCGQRGTSCHITQHSAGSDEGRCVRAKSLQLCVTLWDPMDCSLPGSSVHGILLARILAWVAMPSSRGSSLPRDWTHVSSGSCIAGGLLTAAPPGKPWRSDFKCLQLQCVLWYLPLDFFLALHF